MLPHVLFVRSFEERQKAAMSCWLGWNISLFPDAERDEHIERVWKMVEADNQESAPPRPGTGFQARFAHADYSETGSLSLAEYEHPKSGAESK